MELVEARQNASSSVGVIIKTLCTDVIEKAKPEVTELSQQVAKCLGNGCNSRLSTTMTLFIFFLSR